MLRRNDNNDNQLQHCPIHHMYLVYSFFLKKSVICQLTMLIQGYEFVVFILLCLEGGACIWSLWRPDVTEWFTFKWLINSCSDLACLGLPIVCAAGLCSLYRSGSLGWRFCVCLHVCVHACWPCCPQERLQVTVRHCGYDIRQAMWQEGRAAQMKGKHKTTR